jgi:hypothetical protein
MIQRLAAYARERAPLIAQAEGERVGRFRARSSVQGRPIAAALATMSHGPKANACGSVQIIVLSVTRT